MKFDIRAAALTAGSITALVYTLCTLFCVLVPESTLVYVTSLFFHFDARGLYREVTWGSFIVSLLGWALGMAFMTGATAWLYNLTAQTSVCKTDTLAGQRDSSEARRAS